MGTAQTASVATVIAAAGMAERIAIRRRARAVGSPAGAMILMLVSPVVSSVRISRRSVLSGGRLSYVSTAGDSLPPLARRTSVSITDILVRCRVISLSLYSGRGWGEGAFFFTRTKKNPLPWPPPEYRGRGGHSAGAPCIAFK